jgi:hypothetical protein
VAKPRDAARRWSKALHVHSSFIANEGKGHVHSNAKLDGSSELLDQPLVLIVRADPEPHHFITFDRA